MVFWNSISVKKMSAVSILDNIAVTSSFSLSLVIERQVASFSFTLLRVLEGLLLWERI